MAGPKWFPPRDHYTLQYEIAELPTKLLIKTAAALEDYRDEILYFLFNKGFCYDPGSYRPINPMSALIGSGQDALYHHICPEQGQRQPLPSGELTWARQKIGGIVLYVFWPNVLLFFLTLST